MKFSAYNGNQPYIFVSYAHKDNKLVSSVLDPLYDSGYRIWYDEGITPGSEWPEEVASHLNGSSLFIAFISNNAMNSENCRREINFALSLCKPFLAIVLEKTNMSLGMQMQLSTQQSIIRYNFASWDSFMNKIKKCPALKPCLGVRVNKQPKKKNPFVSTQRSHKKEIEKLIAEAEEYKSKGDYHSELSVVLSAFEIEPNNIDVLIHLGVAYSHHNRMDLAYSYYEKVLELDPENPIAYNNIGVLYLDTGKYEIAKSHFEHALKLYSKRPSYNCSMCYSNYALTIGKMGNISGALDSLRIAKKEGCQQSRINEICWKIGTHPSILESDPIQL